MIQIEEWSRSRDDALEMIQIEWWSISSDDDLDQEMIQIRLWIEDKDDLKTNMTWRRDDLADTEKKTSAENCVERRPS